MKLPPLVLALLAAAALFVFWQPPQSPPAAGLVPAPSPTKPNPPQPLANAGKPVEGGKVSPDGSEEVVCDLPESLREHNTGGRDGSGLCVFTSIEYAAKYQGVKAAMDLQAKMKKEPGGGYPQKVEAELKKFGINESYINDTSGDPAVLKAILDSGRLACVTYNGHDPHYGNQTIAHMVCLPAYSDRWAAIYDNNYTSDSQLVWMSPEEFQKRWKAKGGGWVFAWLAAPPPPIPHN